MSLRLDALKAHNLKSLAFLLGCAVPTTKTALIDAIQCSLQGPRFKQGRILSIDMGIKNFAYCVLDVSGPDFRITRWTKRNLVQDLTHSSRGSTVFSASPGLGDTDTDDDVSSAELFNPPNVSKMAFNLTEYLLRYKPDAILIEQQRFRSGGGSAIQEWTIRVNMLESMLWACLESRRRLGAGPAKFSINPTKVARFWVGGLGSSLTPRTALTEDKAAAAVDEKGSKKITKADKMNVLKGWLDQTGPDAIPITFSDEAQGIADLFKKTSRRTSSKTEQSSRTKLDDYTDCVLQGAAWLQWQRNRAEIAAMFGYGPTVSDGDG